MTDWSTIKHYILSNEEKWVTSNLQHIHWTCICTKMHVNIVIEVNTTSVCNLSIYPVWHGRHGFSQLYLQSRRWGLKKFGKWEHRIHIFVSKSSDNIKTTMADQWRQEMEEQGREKAPRVETSGRTLLSTP